MTTRMRVPTSGTAAQPADFAANPGPGKVLSVTAGGDDVEWGTAPPSPAAGAPVNVNAAAANIGTAGSYATADHKHSSDTGNPVSVGVANAPGVAPELTRRDHVHSLSSTAIPAAYADAWAITDWYIDGTIGNDANNGTTALTPIKTGAELLRRLGPYAMWGQSVTIHVLENGMIDGLIVRGALLVAGTHVDVSGTPTLLAAATTIATYAPVNHATPVAVQVTLTAVADVTPYQWKRLRLTSGANSGAVAWILTANPAGAGLATARTTPFGRINTVSTSAVTSTVAAAPGDGVVIEDLPLVPSIDVLLDGPPGSSPTALYPQRQCYIQSVRCPSITLQTSASNSTGKTLLFGCRLSRTNSNFIPTATLSAFAILGSLIGNDIATVSSTIILTAPMQASGVGEGLQATRVQVGPGIMSLVAVTFQGTRLFCNNCQCSLSDVQIFDYTDVANPALQIQGGCIINVVSNLSGANNTGYGIGIQNNCSIRLLGTINLQGLLSNARLLSTPAVNLTLPNLLQPDDYAQKGIATLVAGTVAVIVPWWDPTIQRLTFGRNTPSGAIGDLSAPTASRTSTQFVINSANPADTSTVDWQISPLGRNIFISTA